VNRVGAFFNKGHRIRVTVSSSNTVHLSAKHPSHVLLPVYAGPGGGGGKGVEKSR